MLTNSIVQRVRNWNWKSIIFQMQFQSSMKWKAPSITTNSFHTKHLHIVEISETIFMLLTREFKIFCRRGYIPSFLYKLCILKRRKYGKSWKRNRIVARNVIKKWKIMQNLKHGMNLWEGSRLLSANHFKQPWL